MPSAQTLVAANGPLPIKTTFDLDSNAEVLLYVAGSGWVPQTGWITIAVLVDGNEVGAINVYSNEASSHKSCVSAFFPLTLPLNPNDMSHTLTLQAVGTTNTDVNDSFNVTLIY